MSSNPWEDPMSNTMAAAADRPVEPERTLESVLGGYRSYLLDERGLSEATAVCYEPRARLFLSSREGRKDLGLDVLTAADVTGFLGRECPSLGAASAQLLVAVVRSLLRYLHATGLIAVPLEWAVPAVAAVRGRSLPRGLEPATVTALLSGCDRRRTVGRRDYAILLLGLRLGLRASEVAQIALEDVRWRTGEIVVHGKGGRVDVLPLPVDVGEALAGYLQHRPTGPEGCRTVFLKAIAPVGPMSRYAVGAVVRDASLRAGVPRVACHQLRHTAASGMLQAGATLDEIGEVLRHRERRTTAIYARVDRAALRALARPWPEVTA
jgi:integrase/recombinase XerD